MFCPECRKHWDAPRKAEEAKGQKRAAQRSRCSVCGALLAHDRLIAEFPAGQEPQRAGAGRREHRLTVGDVLRETAGPSPVEGFKASSRTEECPGVRRGWTGFKRESSGYSETEWTGSDSPVIPRGFGRPKKRLAPLNIVLDFAMLIGIVVLVVAVIIHSVISFGRTARNSRPNATVVAVSKLGTQSASAETLAPAPVLPQTVGDWSRLGGPAILSTAGQTGTVVFASYEYGSHSVGVWVQKAASPSSAGSVLDNMSRQTRNVRTPAGVALAAQDPQEYHGHLGVVFDAPSPIGAADNSAALSSAPGVSVYPHSRSWIEDNSVVTVASDSAADRDDFAGAYTTK
jgi:hypothetical protein